MKIAFIVCNDVYTPRVMEILTRTGIDFYTRWENVLGKGHGTEPHLGTRSFPETNSVLLIAFEQEEPLARLIQQLAEANSAIIRADDKIRLFQVPLEKIL
ncbi:MAG: hypothetical protein H6Q30_2594 [Bacteroidetes bacterium]|nr:hypothetical protein [Bacteroidota bacterium]